MFVALDPVDMCPPHNQQKVYVKYRAIKIRSAAHVARYSLLQSSYVYEGKKKKKNENKMKNKKKIK